VNSGKRDATPGTAAMFLTPLSLTQLYPRGPFSFLSSLQNLSCLASRFRFQLSVYLYHQGYQNHRP
jgi:hypothetical protein